MFWIRQTLERSSVFRFGRPCRYTAVDPPRPAGSCALLKGQFRHGLTHPYNGERAVSQTGTGEILIWGYFNDLPTVDFIREAATAGHQVNPIGLPSRGEDCGETQGPDPAGFSEPIPAL